MSRAQPFAHYDAHYTRMGNEIPDWRVAERSPTDYACRRPWLPENRDAQILDFGCGWGSQLLALWCAGYRNLEGVEISREQAEIGRRMAAGRVSIVCEDGRQFLEARRTRFDLIVMNDVIEHIPPSECLTLLEQLFLALRPGGRLVVRTPNMACLAAAYSRYLDVTHTTGFVEASLEQALGLAGFVNVTFLSDYQVEWWKWRPWNPLKHTGITILVNRALHRLVYGVRMQTPKPTRFGMNLEAWAERPL